MTAPCRPPFLNLLEPPAFAALFHEHPPMGFSSAIEAELSLFFADFDLRTTLDSTIQKHLAKIPFFSSLTSKLKFATCFVGSTVTEYVPLPNNILPGELLDDLLQRRSGKQSLTIIKDLPTASPLLPDDDNVYSGELARIAVELGFIEVEGQALAYLPLDFGNLEGYFSMLSPGRRKDLRRKMKTRKVLDVEILHIGDARFSSKTFQGELYAMYLAVYEQSQIHFDLLSPAFFAALLCSREVEGVVVCYRYGGMLVGYNICLIHNGLFIDKYIGFRYPLARELNLYFMSWLVNLEIAMQRGCSTYVAGWTDPEVKAALGARFTFTRHLVWVRNPILRRILYPLRHFFESDSRTLSEKP